MEMVEIIFFAHKTMFSDLF